MLLTIQALGFSAEKNGKIYAFIVGDTKELCLTKRREGAFSLKDSDNLEGFFALLLSFNGTVSFSAARVGEVAGCDDDIGSYFTRAFLQSIRTRGSERSLSWDVLCKQIVKKTGKIAEDFGDRFQHPIYRIAK